MRASEINNEKIGNKDVKDNENIESVLMEGGKGGSSNSGRCEKN